MPQEGITILPDTFCLNRDVLGTGWFKSELYDINFLSFFIFSRDD